MLKKINKVCKKLNASKATRTKVLEVLNEIYKNPFAYLSYKGKRLSSNRDIITVRISRKIRLILKDIDGDIIFVDLINRESGYAY